MKYDVLHRSYSEPVRVCVRSTESVVVARAITRGIGVCAGDTLRGAVARDDFVARAVAERETVDLFVVVVRGVNVDVRTAARVDFVEFARRCWVFAFVPFFAREATPPSRTAAPAPLIHIRADIAKIRTFFISDEMLANL